QSHIECIDAARTRRRSRAQSTSQTARCRRDPTAVWSCADSAGSLIGLVWQWQARDPSPPPPGPHEALPRGVRPTGAPPGRLFGSPGRLTPRSIDSSAGPSRGKSSIESDRLRAGVVVLEDLLTLRARSRHSERTGLAEPHAM